MTAAKTRAPSVPLALKERTDILPSCESGCVATPRSDVARPFDESMSVLAAAPQHTSRGAASLSVNLGQCVGDLTQPERCSRRSALRASGVILRAEGAAPPQPDGKRSGVAAGDSPRRGRR